MRAVLLLAVLALAPGAALADFTGRVVKVADGDTLTVLVDKKHIRVRLDGIDAPERGQAFGKQSRQSLAQLCAAKDARVVERGKDRHGHTAGVVTCATVEANSEQVRRGMAWAFKGYVPMGSALYELETYARLRKIGLWADARPVAPWDWREAQRAKPRKGEQPPSTKRPEPK
jgi:endonuclease YncB( thermonuclease family)